MKENNNGLILIWSKQTKFNECNSIILLIDCPPIRGLLLFLWKLFYFWWTNSIIVNKQVLLFIKLILFLVNQGLFVKPNFIYFDSILFSLIQFYFLWFSSIFFDSVLFSLFQVYFLCFSSIFFDSVKSEKIELILRNRTELKQIEPNQGKINWIKENWTE